MTGRGWAWHPYDLPLRVPYRWAKGIQTRRLGLLVRLDLGDGVGWGECAPPPHEPTDGAALAAGAARLVDGLDPGRDDFLERLDERRPDPRLRCAVSTAWHARRAVLGGVSLARSLGSPAESVPVNALLIRRDPDALTAEAHRRRGEGVRTLKLKVGPDRDRDLRRVAAVREAAPDAALRLDANESWSPAWALEHLEALAPLDIEYVEQPLPAHDPGALVRLNARSPIPLALDESATDAATLDRLLAAGAGTVAILKPQRLGGPDGTLRAMEVARDHGVPAVVTNSLETAVGRTVALHLAALLPRPVPACGLDTGHYLARDAARGPVAVEGEMVVPTGPGLGWSGGRSEPLSDGALRHRWGPGGAK